MLLQNGRQSGLDLNSKESQMKRNSASKRCMETIRPCSSILNAVKYLYLHYISTLFTNLGFLTWIALRFRDDTGQLD